MRQLTPRGETDRRSGAHGCPLIAIEGVGIGCLTLSVNATETENNVRRIVPAPGPLTVDGKSGERASQERARQITPDQAKEAKSGLAGHVGAKYVCLAIDIASQGWYLVQAVASDVATWNVIRTQIAGQGRLEQVGVRQWNDGELPFDANSADMLIVARRSLCAHRSHPPRPLSLPS